LDRTARTEAGSPRATSDPDAAEHGPEDGLEAALRRRATKLHAAAAALSRATTRDEVARIVVGQGLAATDARAAVAYFLSDDTSLVYAASQGLPEEAIGRLRTLPVDAPLPLCNAVRTNTPVWIDTYELLVATYPNLRDTATPTALLQTVAALPMAAEGRVTGGLAFSFEPGRRFDDDERTFLLTLTEHASLALERARLHGEELAARNRLTVLAEASRRFTEAKLDLQEILDTVAREVATRLGDSCAVNLLSEDGKTLEPVSIHNVDPEADASSRRTMATAPVRMDEGSSLAKVARSGKPVLVPVVPLTAHFAPNLRPEYQAHLERFPIGSLLVVPLRLHETVIGTMTASRGREGAPYNEQDQSLLQDLADRAAFAISNARQYEQLQHERHRLDLLSNMSKTLATSLDYETTLRNVVELALPTLGDFGFFDVVESTGDVRRIARAHENPELEAALAQTKWVRSERQDKILCALSSGQSGFHPEIDDAWLIDVATSPEHLAVMRELSFRSMVTVPLAYRDRTVGALTLFFSRSQRRHSDADLRLAEELARRAAAAVENARLFKEAQEAIAIRDDFLSIASHELNTPLTALQLQVQSLKRHAMAENRNEKLVERLTKTEGHVGRLEKLVNELLDVSRITGGRLRIDPAEMDLTSTARDVTERLAAHAAAHRSTIVFGADRPVVGSWDRMRIEQVVVNLINNAVKYGAGKPIEVNVGTAGGSAFLSVRDEGIGISPDDEERIFGRFERAVSQRHYGGFGLGLWIARQIVEAHHGSIRFERPADAGTRFVVELPLVTTATPK
jgi:signal transduction histidine kinase